MKKFILKCVIILVVISVFTGCKKFLTVTPTENLSGTTFWQTRADAEAFTLGIYHKFRDVTCVKSCFYPGTGDLRCAPVTATQADHRKYITFLSYNNLKSLLSSTDWWGYDTYGFGFNRITDWSNFYAMVQSANILYKEVDKVSITDAQKKQYKAEAVFLRCLAYFFMVRLYGDVPYYTNAYNETALPRTNMVTVLKNCIADMDKAKGDLPWTFSDPAYRGVRAMRGGAIALMMHMNMWAACFDQTNKDTYYQAVVSLGDEILTQSGNAYELLPLEETKTIFKGRTKEGLFEIPQNLNYGETFGLGSTYFDLVLRTPYKKTITNSYISYDKKFLEDLYPNSVTDMRKDLWFDENMYNTSGLFVFRKFINVYAREGEDVNSDDNMIIFRLADVYMLIAEAYAELGGSVNEGQARDMVNMVRNRAHATPIPNDRTGEDLKDDIFNERCRELMGEAHYYYDIVRTRRILDAKKSYRPMTLEAFRRGAWTWPISNAATKNNPYVTLNDYWK